MNIIVTMFEEFLDILGLTSKRRANYEAQKRAKEAYKIAYKDGYSAGYRDASNELPHKYKPQTRPKIQRPETIILFVKADRGSTLIDVIRNNNTVAGISSDQLVSDVFRVWAGTEKQFDSIGFNSLFLCEPEYSKIGKEYDSVAIVLPYPSGANIITKSSDSFVIAEVIRETVAQGLSCRKISNRLSFSKIEGLPLIDV